MIRSDITKNQILAAADRNDARKILNGGKLWRIRFKLACDAGEPLPNDPLPAVSGGNGLASSTSLP